MVEHELPKLGARVRFPSPAPPLPIRLLSWWWDYLLILVWLAVVLLVAGLPQLLGWVDLSPVWTDQNAADVGITLLTVLPYLLYLTVTESGAHHATWGKRRVGIAVVGRNGAEPATGAVLLRNLVKVAPWQLGHMGAMRLTTATEIPPVAVWLQGSSMVLLALIVIPILFRRPGIHDLVAGTRVVRAGS
jgi:uncharacterized RDD family membrane protein YckC